MKKNSRFFEGTANAIFGAQSCVQHKFQITDRADCVYGLDDVQDVKVCVTGLEMSPTGRCSLLPGSAEEGFNPVYDRRGDSMALKLCEYAVVQIIKCFGAIRLNYLNCTPFVKPSSSQFFRRKVC